MLQVYANYGAMFPTYTLTIASIVEGIATATNQDGDTQTFNVNDIRAERPTSGSPIGIYWNERDAY
jgi:hypothetical protein